MSDKSANRSMFRRGQGATSGPLEPRLKALQQRYATPRLRPRVHAPLNLSSEPRTDVPADRLVSQPWLKFYPANVGLDLASSEAVLPDLLADSAARFAEQPAIFYFGHKLTYREVDQAASRLAAGLWEQGVRPGDRVALLLPNCPQFVIAYYGALRIGVIVVPCNPLYIESELEHQLRDAGASVLVTLTVFYKTARAVRDRLGLKTLIVGNVKDYFPPALQLVFTVSKEKKDGHRVTVSGEGVWSWLDFLAAAKSELPAITVRPDDIALYQYTGGTTGVPKGAMLSHRNLVTNARMCWAWLGDGEKGRDVTLAAIPLFHVYGMTAALNVTVFAGGALVLLPRFAPLEVLKAVQRYRPTLFPGVPAMYISLLNHPQLGKFDLTSIEACISGAAPLPLEVAQRFERITGAKLAEGFGMTECSPVSHGNPLYGQRKEGSIGVPFPGVEARIVDVETGQQVMPTGEIGEMVVRGPMVMRGYYNRPDETAQTLRDGWLYTGDIARMDEEGYFFIVDRKKDMILSNGFNVYPRDVEEVLYTHPAVREAVVIGAPNERGDDTVKAFVVLKDGQSVSADELIAFARERLTRYKAPRAIEFRAELPKTLIGKHLRRVLVEEERQKLAAHSPQPPTIEPVTATTRPGSLRGLHLPSNLTPHIPKVSVSVPIKVRLPENFRLPRPHLKWPFAGQPDDRAAS